MAGKGTTKNIAVEPEGAKQTEYMADGANVPETKKVTESGRKEEAKETLIYIGPTVKAGLLRTNAVFTGTREEIRVYLGDILRDITQVEKLMIPVARLAESKGKVKEKGTLLNKYYNDVASLDHAKKEG